MKSRISPCLDFAPATTRLIGLVAIGRALGPAAQQFAWRNALGEPAIARALAPRPRTKPIAAPKTGSIDLRANLDRGDYAWREAPRGN